MTVPLDITVDEEGGVPERREYAYIPRADYEAFNQAGRDMNGVQTGSVYGDIINMRGSSEGPELLVRIATEEEKGQVRAEFVRPEKFDEAERKIAINHVVLLCGKGTGRTFAGRRLLDSHGVTEIIDLNPDRLLGSISESDLRRGEGYLWDASELGGHPFTHWEFDRVAAMVRGLECRLVIVLDNRRQAPAEAARYIVSLTPPDPVEVAVAILDHRCSDAGEQAKQVLKCDLASALAAGDPPQKAVRAALLAMEVAEDKRTAADALRALSEDIEDVVAASFESWSTTEYSMSLAVALLEHHSFDEVAAYARKLDDMIRQAELPKDIPLPPQQMFAMSRNKLLNDIHAVVDKREHPRRPGLYEETVRFARQDWADAVLRHVWREYYVAQTVLRDWMCAPTLLERFRGASERALCTLITGVPAHDSLRLVDHLASRHSVAQRELAVRVLNRLADAHGLRPSVEQILEQWVSFGSVYRHWTAALVYGSSFSQHDLDQALVQLTCLGHSSNERVQNAVVQGVLDLLSRRDARDRVLNTVVAWLSRSSFTRSDGLHTVALAVAMGVVGFSSESAPVTADSALLAEAYPEQVCVLAEAVFDDQQFGPIALTKLSWLARMADLELRRESDWSTMPASAQLLRLVSLLSPDLRWWARRRMAAALGRQYPTKRTEIRRIFRIAGKLRARGAQR